MTNNRMLKAIEVMKILNVSKSQAYKIIKQMNLELTDRGYQTIPGRISEKYFNEKYFGYDSRQEANK